MKYTPNEEKLLKILRKKKGKKLTSLQLVEMHYPDEGSRPTYARQSVVTVLNSLIPKTRRNKSKDGFVLCKSPRSGPHPNQYWVE